MKSVANIFYISALMAILVAVVLQFSALQWYEDRYPVYEGVFIDGFEYSLFVSCNELKPLVLSKGDSYTTDIEYGDVPGFSRSHKSHISEEYEPVYLKARAALIENEGHTWMGFSHRLEVKEVIEMRRYDDRRCDPPYNPQSRMIEVEYDAETPVDVFERIKQALP